MNNVAKELPYSETGIEENTNWMNLTNLLEKLLLNAPSYGAITLKVVFHSGKLCRIIHNYESTVLPNSLVE